MKVAEDRALGVTEKDKKMRTLGVENGRRAEAIVKELNKKKTVEEKAELLREYAKKKILTEEVSKQVLELLKNQ